MVKVLKPQLSDDAKFRLTRQKYKIVGDHSVVKTCCWTRNMINGIGGCYKLKFYGIMSHQCLQMSPSVSCANRCTFCWRDYKSPVSKEWKWSVDDPQFILDKSLKAHHDLLTGYHKNGKSNQNLYHASKNVRHVALSLTGEPISYPRINELLALFHKQGISTFLVTNAQFPEAIKSLAPVTQLYLSVDAPTPELLRVIDRPLFKDYWDRLRLSLQYLSEKKHRTCVRLTIIKGANDKHQKEYAELLSLGNPDFIEVKSYMHVGASRTRHTRSQVARMSEVNKFAKELLNFLPEYEWVTDYSYSDVCLLAKKKFKIDGKWHTWIDFDKFADTVNKGEEIGSLEYVKRTP